jgi:hypothetical protein
MEESLNISIQQAMFKSVPAKHTGKPGNSGRRLTRFRNRRMNKDQHEALPRKITEKINSNRIIPDITHPCVQPFSLFYPGTPMIERPHLFPCRDSSETFAQNSEEPYCFLAFWAIINRIFLSG